MLNTNQLIYLYTRVLKDLSYVNNISEKDIKQAIEHMHKIYQGSSNSLSNDFKDLTNFNEVTYRCAYLFKYAPFHTALSYKAMSHALTESHNELKAVLNTLSGPLKICSLGAGPGTDVIGVLVAMHNQFGFFPTSVKLVDIMSEWKSTFWSIIDELRFEQQNYGCLSESVSEKWFDWSFIGADLQSEMSKELTEVLGTADIVTMIKFVSATACKETSLMIERIFRVMKPGAFLLFLDNAGGGFEKLISNAADKYELNAISTPLKHLLYRNEKFNYFKYGYRSCYESKIALQFLMKSVSINCSNENHLTDKLSYKEDLASSSDAVWQKIHIPQFQNFRIGPKLVDNFMYEHQTFGPGSQSNVLGNDSFLLSDFPTKLIGFRMPTENPVRLYESFESESSWNSSPHSSDYQNWSVKGKNQIFDSEYQNKSFGYRLFSNPHFSRLHYNNFLSSPPSYGQKMHSPKLQNFRIDSKQTGDPINEYDTFKQGSLSVFPVGSFSPSSEFFPEVDEMKMQTDYSSSHNKSFETGLTWNSPLNFSPQNSSNQNRHIKVVDQIYDSIHKNYSCEGKLHLNTPLNKRLPTIQVSQTVSNSKLNITGTDNSDYSEESFENELLWDSPVYNKSLHFRSTPRQSRYVLLEDKTDYSFHKKRSFWNTSKNNLAKHCTLMPPNEISLLSPIPCRPNLHQLYQSTSISFEKHDNSVHNQNPLDFESPFHQTWNNDCHLFENLQNPEKNIETKEQSNVPLYQRKSSEPKRSEKKQSKNGSFSLGLPHQHPGKFKAQKKRFNFSVHRHQPYETKRSVTKQSKQACPESLEVPKRHVILLQHKSNEPKISLTNESKNVSFSLEPPQQHTEKFKAPKRNYRVSVHQHKPNEIKRSQTMQSKRGPRSLRPPHDYTEKFKAVKRYRNVSRNQCKPTESKNVSVSSKLAHQQPGKFKEQNRWCVFSVPHHKSNQAKNKKNCPRSNLITTGTSSRKPHTSKKSYDV